MAVAAVLGTMYGGWLHSAKSPDNEKVIVFLSRDLEDPVFLAQAVRGLQEADLIFFYDSGEDSLKLIREMTSSISPPQKLIKLGWESGQWGGTEKPEILVRAHRYISNGGRANAAGLLEFLQALDEGCPEKAPLPVDLPGFGLWHPEAPEIVYENIKDYLPFLEARIQKLQLYDGVCGLVFHRIYWATGDLAVEKSLILALEEEGLAVLPVMVEWTQDPQRGQSVLTDLEKSFNGQCGPKIDLLVKLVSTFSSPGQVKENLDFSQDSPTQATVNLFKSLDVPVLQPHVSYSQSPAEWEADPLGIGREAAWTMTMTEFEGAIEPFFVGGKDLKQVSIGAPTPRLPHEERIKRLAKRAKKWIALKRTPPAERKVAFIFHNNPCGSAEGTVGVGAGLDAAESLVRIGKALKQAGYLVDVPETGRALLADIMEKKAISEFRWTSAAEIVERGGSLDLISSERYLRWFNEFPEKVKSDLIETWGHPPGEIIEDVPPAMVYKDQIIISGYRLGLNALVMVQPKRGCAGSRCDGRVCRILQDPLIPPPHQYLASYRWLRDEEMFGAHLVVHIGTLGNLEFLPGKSAGLSESCYGDLALSDLPNIYLYDSWDSGAGLTAKRRSYAALVDHMPPPTKRAELPGHLGEIEDLMAKRHKLLGDEGRKKLLEEAIVGKIDQAGLRKTFEPLDGDFEELAYKLLGFLNEVRLTTVEDGLHVFGDVPEGERLGALAACILKFDSGTESFRNILSEAGGFDLNKLIAEPAEVDSEGVSNSQYLSKVDQKIEEIVTRAVLGDDFLDLAEKEVGPDHFRKNKSGWTELSERLDVIFQRAGASREIPAFMRGLNGGYIMPGPSASVLRGREDVLPTGRNFFTQDPRRLPTPMAWKIGRELAEAAAQKYLSDEGRWPESVAFFWISTDLLQNDGEDFSQMLALMGLKPRWSESGVMNGVNIIPLAELGRPRIDVLCRISGILRDSFSEIVDHLDRASVLVSSLDEPTESNYVRKHTLEKLVEERKKGSEETAWRRATYRVFSSPPGSCQSGVYLAIMASAWNDGNDLTEIYLQHGSYAYGEGTFGELNPRAFKAALGQVDVNFSKIYNDSNDFLGTGWRFGTQGGLSIAAETIKGRKIRNYCGDVRAPLAPKVRSLAEEISRSAMARLLNPVWIEGQKRHGYKGALEITKRLGNAFGWQATTNQTDPGIFDRAAEMFLLDHDSLAFFKEHNPWALEEMGRRLLEAESRGLWRPESALLAKIKDSYLELEGVLEEKTEAYGGDIQGGAVDIVTRAEVGKWQENWLKIKSD
ncbi:MAG: cobaltochelatase subunit CobN [Deltaproteobacteria bacterium]|jgi:cobaltochelatase CobN|nr:cobaltochelatase subunit CobN [Deltaproteobacteria bacterium]